MQFERVLLVNPSYPGSMERASLCAGLGYLAETLEQASIEYDVMDMELDHDFWDLRRKIMHFAPDLIGVSMMTYKCKHNYGLLQSVKGIMDAPIVVGGPHISALGEQVLRECASIDFGVVGEGEEAIMDLCKGRDFDQITNLIYRHDGDIVRTKQGKPIPDLDAVPFPRYRRFELSKYLSRTIPIVSSRGCPYSCIFCSVAILMGKKVRTRSPEKVVAEIEYWYAKGHRRFGFVDDNLTFDEKRMYVLCDIIEHRKFKGVEFLCLNGVRADRVTKELLKRMKHVGFRFIAFGVEGGNDKVLKSIKKGESMRTIEGAIQDACDLAYEVTLHFVIGTPGETWDDIEDSFALAKKYPVSNVYFNNLMPYPGAELYEWAKRKDCFVIEPTEYFDAVSSWSDTPVFQTPELSAEERCRALSKAREISKKVRRRYYENKLKKLGVGASIIVRLIPIEEIKNFLRSNRIGRVMVRLLLRYFFSRIRYGG